VMATVINPTMPTVTTISINVMPRWCFFMMALKRP
jgi:hypothetical protein